MAEQEETTPVISAACGHKSTNHRVHFREYASDGFDPPEQRLVQWFVECIRCKTLKHVTCVDRLRAHDISLLVISGR